MALCQLAWIEEGSAEHPHRIEVIRKALQRLSRIRSCLIDEPAGVEGKDIDRLIMEFAEASYNLGRSHKFAQQPERDECQRTEAALRKYIRALSTLADTDAAQATIERLARALEPFAKIAELHNDTAPPNGDTLYVWEKVTGTAELSMTDCVEARAALAAYRAEEK
ncbi:hypothetical protein GOB45_29515 [Sinorhizobium meliloti]|uniref:hypothetical protein n=1 Tax=Rhizobium meliloti TaxID=382 RepID=UPI00299E0D48|nr:hypothetical protein [Sinorhizobium meliloti]